MSRRPSLTDAARVESLLLSLNRKSADSPAKPRKTVARGQAQGAPATVSRPNAETELDEPAPNWPRRTREYTSEQALPYMEDAELKTVPVAVPAPSEVQIPEAADENETAVSELLAISELDLGAGLQSRLIALVGRLVRNLKAVDGFVADESGLIMAGPDICEDAAARSSLAWSFLAGREVASTPEFIVFSQNDDRVVHVFLIFSALGRITVGVRAQGILPTSLIETTRKALSQAFPAS